jgi:ubiquinol-cytochrome c reductase iron-sulfur subunit
MADHEVNERKRGFLVAATSIVGGAVVGAAAVPFVGSMLPSERAKAAGAPVEVDISQLAPGAMMRVEWRGKPVWVVRRTKEMLDTLPKLDSVVADPKSSKDQQPGYCKNEYRSIKPEFLVLVGVCTHLGCSPMPEFTPGAQPFEANWQGGFYCPCHGSIYDLAGRVYKNKPAPTNLEVPPYKYLSDAKIVIGVASEGA